MCHSHRPSPHILTPLASSKMLKLKCVAQNYDWGMIGGCAVRGIIPRTPPDALQYLPSPRGPIVRAWSRTHVSGVKLAPSRAYAHPACAYSDEQGSRRALDLILAVARPFARRLVNPRHTQSQCRHCRDTAITDDPDPQSSHPTRWPNLGSSTPARILTRRSPTLSSGAELISPPCGHLAHSCNPTPSPFLADDTDPG